MEWGDVKSSRWRSIVPGLWIVLFREDQSKLQTRVLSSSTISRCLIYFYYPELHIQCTAMVFISVKEKPVTVNFNTALRYLYGIKMSGERSLTDIVLLYVL
jgi:hypothetical protein